MRWSATVDSQVTLVDDAGAWDEHLHRRINVVGEDLAEAVRHAAERYLTEVVPSHAQIKRVHWYQCTLTQEPAE